MKKLFTLLTTVVLSLSAYAQCVTGWAYYLPITINNPNATPLTNHQVLVSVNTASLISAGHMQATGDDIRFVGSTSCCDILGHSVDAGMNTSSTGIWVKVPSVPANGTATIYMFYGNASAPNGENPAATFDLYEDFSTPPYHFSQDACGSGTASPSAGQVTFSWGSNAVWVSDSTFPLTAVYTAEANVTAASGNWPGVHWLKTTDQRGYGMLASGPNSPRLSETGNSSGYCQGHNWASAIMTATSPVGIWSSTWISTGNITGVYPTTGVINSTSTTHSKDASMKVVIGGISSGSGSMTIDWIRVRKYAAATPVASVGSETPAPGGPPSGFLGADQNVCVGNPVTLDVTSFGFPTHLWSTGATTASITVSTTDTYWFQSTDAMFGCPIADTVNITFNPLPVVSLGNDTIICSGSVTLDAGNPGSVYAWSTAENSQTILAGTSGAYDVTVTDPLGCSASDTINVTIVNLSTSISAVPPMVCLDDGAVMLSGTPSGGTFSGPGVSGNTFVPMNAGAGAHTISYVYTDSLGCSDSDSISVMVDLCMGADELPLSQAINVYPNPNNGIFTLNVLATTGEMLIEVTDVSGRVVYSSIQNNVNAGSALLINMENEANGLYLMKVTAGGQQTVIPVSIAK